MEYYKNVFVDNVYALAKARGMKIKDLESGCGVSLGYFARLRQGEKNIAPGADLLMAVADRLSVSVDALLTSFYAQKCLWTDCLISLVAANKLLTETMLTFPH